MLDLEDPQAAHVFAASRQLDLICDYVKRISCSASDARLFMLEVIRPCFVALRWIHTQHFGDRPHLGALLDEFEHRAEGLASLNGGQVERLQDEHSVSSCPVCGQRLSFASERQERWCAACVEGVFNAIKRVASIDEGFGTEAI